jgi:hypothetical protein
MHKNKNSANFHFHPRCRKENITDLLFADDLLMFCQADKASVQSVMLTFSRFSKASWLETNTNKSNAYISGVDKQSKDRLLQFLQMEEGFFPSATWESRSTPKSSMPGIVDHWWIKSLVELVTGPLASSLTRGESS